MAKKLYSSGGNSMILYFYFKLQNKNFDQKFSNIQLFKPNYSNCRKVFRSQKMNEYKYRIPLCDIRDNTTSNHEPGHISSKERKSKNYRRREEIIKIVVKMSS